MINENKTCIRLMKLPLIMFALVISGLALCLLPACSSDSDQGVDGDYDLELEVEREISDAVGGTISIELSPPAQSGLPIQQVVDLSLDNFDGVLTLEPSVKYSGRVVDPDGNPIEAGINLVHSTLNDMIPGHPLPQVSISTSDPDKLGDAIFSADVLTSYYSRLVYPVDQGSYPPLIFYDDLNIDSALSETIAFLRGYRIDGSVLDGDGEPQAGVKVYAYESGDELRRTNFVYTEDDGSFSQLHLPNYEGHYNVSLSASQDAPLWPTIIFEEAIWVGEEGIVQPEPAKLDLTVDAIERKECRMSGIVSGEDGNPIEGASLLFSGVIGGGRYEKSVDTDENGKYELKLLMSNPESEEDDYSITILPPVESDFAILRPDSLDCGSESVIRDFVLPRRLLLSGAVANEDGIPLADVKVMANKKATSDEGSTAYLKSTQTDSAGRYALRIDPGTYDVSFVAQTGSPLARQVVYDVQLSTDGNLDAQLLPGRLLSGKVLDPEGNLIPSVYLEVFRVRPTKHIAEVIASGTTNEAGEFEIVIP